MVSYNVENLFFPTDDPRHADEEFLPTGARGWGWRKFRTKLDAVGRAIMACGRELPPALVGLCEVEGDSVLRYLARRSLLRGADYRYVTASTSDEEAAEEHGAVSPVALAAAGMFFTGYRFTADGSMPVRSASCLDFSPFFSSR